MTNFTKQQLGTSSNHLPACYRIYVLLQDTWGGCQLVTSGLCDWALSKVKWVDRNCNYLASERDITINTNGVLTIYLRTFKIKTHTLRVSQWDTAPVKRQVASYERWKTVKNEHCCWQESFWEHIINNSRLLVNLHAEYLVGQAADFLFLRPLKYWCVRH